MGYISCQFDVESISILYTLPQKSKKNRHEERKEIDINMNFDPILSIYRCQFNVGSICFSLDYITVAI